MHSVSNITMRKYCSVAFQSCKCDVGSLLKFVVIIIIKLLLVLVLLLLLSDYYYY